MAIFAPRRRVCFPIALYFGLLVLCVEEVLAAQSIQFERASTRITYVREGERATRISGAVSKSDWKTSGLEAVAVDVDDSILVQVGCVDENGDPAHPQQAFIRFVRLGSETDDSVQVMARKPVEMRLDLKLNKEIRADRDFWEQGGAYRMEVIIGDTRMGSEGGGMTWVAIQELTFIEGSRRAAVFKKSPRGVFDFDVGVKKELLPEFSSPIPAPVRQAPLVAVVAAVVLVVAPLPFVGLAWHRLGAFPLYFPERGWELFATIGFELCLLAHIAALAMFWLQWNIVKTWIVMGCLMLLTIPLGHSALSPLASRHMKLVSGHVHVD